MKNQNSIFVVFLLVFSLVAITVGTYIYQNRLDQKSNPATNPELTASIIISSPSNKNALNREPVDIEARIKTNIDVRKLYAVYKLDGGHEGLMTLYQTPKGDVIAEGQADLLVLNSGSHTIEVVLYHQNANLRQEITNGVLRIDVK